MALSLNQKKLVIGELWLRTIISMNFTPKDKKVLDDMVFVINQFYEATKPGGKKTVEV